MMGDLKTLKEMIDLQKYLKLVNISLMNIG